MPLISNSPSTPPPNLTTQPLNSNTSQLATTLALEKTLQLPTFTSDTAFALGTALRERLRHHPKPSLISILIPSGLPAPNSPHHILYQSPSRPGTSPDNAIWVARKASTVFRFGVSSYAMSLKFEQDEELFRKKFGLSNEEAARYAIHGGAFPVRVQGVEGVVAVAVVSGLSQEEDHGVVVETLGRWIEEGGW
jgi:uncharacterized protein (UPF0303 family)